MGVKNEKCMISEKYILVKRRQNSVETDRGSYYNKITIEFSDDKCAFYNGNESDNSDNDDDENENNEQ